MGGRRGSERGGGSEAVRAGILREIEEQRFRIFARGDGEHSAVIGASGAIFGVLIAFGMMFPDRYIFLYFVVPVKAKYFIAGLIVLGVLAVGDAGNVANLAHLGGALAGYFYILYDQRRVPFARFFEQARWKLRQRVEERDPEEAVEAKFFDIRTGQKKEEPPTAQQRIDEILDKISRSGYQNLTDEEKKILFEASKKLN